MIIDTKINQQFNTNTYFIKENEQSDSLVIIDPGEESTSWSEVYVSKKTKYIYILLSHEHFDHITGVGKLKERYPKSILVTSKKCAERITDPKKNFSYYANSPLVCPNADHIIEKTTQTFAAGNLNFRFYPWEGHSPGGMLIELNGSIFTGDQIIKNKKTVTNLPDCNRAEVEKCVAFLKDNFSPNTLLYPGHGEPLMLKELTIY